MKTRLITLLFGLALCGATMQSIAQPAMRRTQQQTSQTQAAKTTSVREFPTAQDMPTDASWRRDIYRSLDLNKDANATLYYPTTPQGDRMNLFTYLFRLIRMGQIKAYEYTLDGNEHFDQRHQISLRKIMDTYEIYYEEVETKDGKKALRINDADLPSDAVKIYFIKESAYYDQHTASFRTKVTAICPVLQRGDSEYGGSELRNPMFWVNYEEAAPYLSKLMLMGSNLNNAAMVSADDYFTMNRYEGDIYKTTNLQDRILANYCPTDSLMKQEQQRIEKELNDFRQHVWGHDSIPADTTAVVADTLASTPAKVATTRTARTRGNAANTASATQKRARTTTVKASSTKTSTAKPAKSSSPKTKAPRSSSSATMSVRKQRH